MAGRDPLPLVVRQCVRFFQWIARSVAECFVQVPTARKSATFAASIVAKFFARPRDQIA